VAVIALGLGTLWPARDRSGWLVTVSLVVGAAVAVAAGTSDAGAPSPVAAGARGFASSSACRSCHPAEYASWHGSFHRTMTQRPDLANVASAVLRGGGRLQVESSGRSVELFGRGRRLWARLPDPTVTSRVRPEEYERAFASATTREVEVRLLTGSHHHQAFWVNGARPGELDVVPAVLLVKEQRLLARRDAFINPPDSREHAVRWNSNCIQCHVVAGAPQHDLERDTFSSSAAELGIACEACHGAGEAHVRAMQSPLGRYRARARDEAPHTVNPEKLSRARGSEVCGRCHSYFFPKHESEWWQHGFSRSYAPGDELARSQLLLSPEALELPDAPSLAAATESMFYRDGTIRIGGREHNGLTRSPCFERGSGERQLSCLSCHSMHASAPNDQLARGKEGNGACAECHQQQAENLTLHTRHAPGSAGSLCYNCHMPHTSYALLGAIRSHRIDSPSFDERTSDRPNACNLCHLERSESWAAAAAARSYGDKSAFRLLRPPALQRLDAPAGAVFALSGDAAVRAITAAALGRLQSDAPDLGLRRQLLDQLAGDPYAAVRAVAERARAELRPGAGREPLAPALVSELLQLRDNRPIVLAE
jgi:predicted CXXCH cytochrome family protein